jgi:hypothetical protein
VPRRRANERAASARRPWPPPTAPAGSLVRVVLHFSRRVAQPLRWCGDLALASGVGVFAIQREPRLISAAGRASSRNQTTDRGWPWTAANFPCAYSIDRVSVGSRAILAERPLSFGRRRSPSARNL